MADIFYTKHSHLVKLLVEVVETLHVGVERKRGRPYTYASKTIVKAFMVMVYFRLKSYRSLSRFLINHREFQRACGFKNEVPSYRTLSRRLKTLDTVVWACAYQIITFLLNHNLVSLTVITTDSSLCKAYGKPLQKKGGSAPTDSDAAWGFSEARGFVWGYKLHVTSSVLLTDKTLIPFAWKVTPANVHDSHLFIPLMETITCAFHKRIHYSLADKGYDQKKHYEWCNNHAMHFVNPVRRFTTQAISQVKQWSLTFTSTPKGKHLSKRRSDIERLFAQLKDLFLIDPLPITGIHNISSYLSIVSFSYLCAIAYNYSHHRPLRALKSVVA